MVEDLPHSVKTELHRFQAAIDKVDKLTDKWIGRSPKDVDAKLGPLQRAQAHLAVAQTLTHVFLLYLRTLGLATAEHPSSKELERLKAYGRKVRKLESAAFLAKNKPSVSLDVAAANRFIDNAIPDLTTEQRSSLKQVRKRSIDADGRVPCQSRDSKAIKSADGNVAAMARAFLEETLGAKKLKI